MRVLCILLYIVSLQMGRDSLHTLVVTTEWDRIMAGQLVRAWQFICQVAGLSLLPELILSLFITISYIGVDQVQV